MTSAPGLLMATKLALLAHFTDCCLAHSCLGLPSSPTCSDHLPGCSLPSQGHCLCTVATRRDADEGLLDATIRAAVTLLHLHTCYHKGLWATQDWWQHVVQHTWDDEHWLEAFRMAQATWDLVELLRLHLEWKDTDLWLPLPTGTDLALTLLKLATPINLWPMKKNSLLQESGFSASLVIF
ncbi:hypothetical protein Y1Q_0001408 [Alligator mississippiensis]|uniref:Uncharacterized protein n=1 Tax=Alligator mississippiensis TaxID=8496 RepID=A0A151M9A1_ALLMI|nr:hypothetical protein Y1Q_0001408 [Alligator mississippiensis]